MTDGNREQGLHFSSVYILVHMFLILEHISYMCLYFLQSILTSEGL